MSAHRVFTGAAVAALVLVLAAPLKGGAYNRPAHEYFADEAAQIFHFPSLDVRLGTIKAGANHEDVEDHVWGHSTVVTCTHFWDADDPDLHHTYYVSLEGYCGNAYMKADELFDQLFAAAAVHDADTVYERLGHIAHLIADMTVPAHAHVDYHPFFDSYDDGWSGSTGEDSHPPNYTQFHHGMANAAGGMIEVPESAIEEIVNNPGAGYDLGWNALAKARLYYLLYTAQQTGDYFPSDGDPGDLDDRHGWMGGYAAAPYPLYLHDEDGNLVSQGTSGIDDNWWYDAGEVAWYFSNHDGDFTTIGRNSMVYAMRAIAGLYKTFRDAFDPDPPVTTPSIWYEFPPNQGWTRGDVQISLSAQDGSAGLYNTLWVLDGDSHYQHFDTEGVLNAAIAFPAYIADEGVHHYQYFSNDWFGNVEDPVSLTFSVDKTAPAVNETTPAAGGFYLTSDTLTIGWNVTDPLSGVASVTATLDGAAVAEGDVLDLATMGGFHTFVLTATDVAGNVAVETVEFSVQIHGVVDFRPNKINVKSGGQDVATFTEFPPGYDVGDIDVSTVEVVFGNWMLAALPAPTALGDFDRDGVVDRLIKFDRSALVYAVTYTPPQGGFTDPLVVSLVVRGQLYGGTEFYASTAVTFTHSD
jgi:hypothetical protein